MDVLNDCVGRLSNYEVMDLLRDLKHPTSSGGKSFLQKLSGKKKLYYSDKGVQNLNTIVYETLEYLEQSRCVMQTSDSVASFLRTIQSYDLTKAEKLQFLNLRPTSLVELQLLIDDGDERINGDQEQEILDVVKQTLPPGPDEAEEAEGAEEAEVEDGS